MKYDFFIEKKLPNKSEDSSYKTHSVSKQNKNAKNHKMALIKLLKKDKITIFFFLKSRIFREKKGFSV